MAFTNQSVLYIHNCDTNNAGQIFYLNMFLIINIKQILYTFFIYETCELLRRSPFSFSNFLSLIIFFLKFWNEKKNKKQKQIRIIKKSYSISHHKYLQSPWPGATSGSGDSQLPRGYHQRLPFWLSLVSLSDAIWGRARDIRQTRIEDR